MQGGVPAKVGEVEAKSDARMEKVLAFLKLIGPVIYIERCHVL
jgi:hypothetical protein